LSNPIELPSLEEIDEMERRQQKAIDSLGISDGFVKCQRAASLFLKA
jgi:hypothetical protein